MSAVRPQILVIDDEPQIHRFLAPALDAAGFDRGVPAVVIWEGVVYYLDEVAVRATLTRTRCGQCTTGKK